MIFLLKIFFALFLFGIIIFIHELGHFITAKLSGVQVNEFALGMGPTLLSKQRGETTYALRLFPIGGFVSMEGENEESTNPRAFDRVGVGRRIAIVAAGAIMNLLLGLMLVCILTCMSDLVPTTIVAKFEEGAPCASYLQTGDTITAINGRRMYTSSDIDFELARDSDGKVDITVVREGKKLQLTGVPFSITTDKDTGTQYIQRDFWLYGTQKTVLGVLRETGLKTLSLARLVWVSLIDFVTGRVAISQVSGPVGTIGVINNAISYGLGTILYLMAVITINVGIFNLLPIPALDGGRLFFLLIEAVTRRRVPQKYEALVHAAGFVVIIGFMLLITFSDITKLFV